MGNGTGFQNCKNSQHSSGQHRTDKSDDISAKTSYVCAVSVSDNGYNLIIIVRFLMKRFC